MNLEEIKNIKISPDTTLKIAMRILSAGKSRVLFVIDDVDKLIGSVTDGDIRRAILNSIEFERPIADIMFKSPRFVRYSEKKFEEKAKRYILDEQLFAIPVLDDTDKIVDVLFWHDFFEKYPLESHIFQPLSSPVVIMAGGKGKRLDPFTKILPKPLIPFGEKPIIERIMDNFYKHGFKNFIVTLNYKKEIIKMYLKENQFPYHIECIEEDDKYLGTAGSLGLLKDKIKEPFFVCNCDIYLEHNFRDILSWHIGEKVIITLIGCHKEMVIPYGTLKVDKGYLKYITEKPTFDLIINTGVYIMQPEVFNFISPEEELDMHQLLERVMKKDKITVYPVCDGWFDMGQWKEYRDSLYLLQDTKDRQ